jgi:iron complex transport system substrate-binding protein
VTRAVSLVPSATDVLAAIGAASSVVGISADCDQPDPSRHVPVITRPLIEPSASLTDSAGVDSSVRSLVDSGAVLYTLDLDTVVELAPDVIFAQDSCSVCALPSAEVVVALTARGLPADVVSVDPTDLDSVLRSFATIGAGLGAALESAGADLAACFRERLGRLAPSADAGAARPGVLVLDWIDPPYVAGNWVPDLVAAAGGAPLLTEAGSPSRPVGEAELAKCEPDLIVVAPCGVDLDGAVQLARRSQWLRSMCARTGAKVVAFDGRIWFSRPGPRLVDGAEALAAWLSADSEPALQGTVEITEMS